MPVPTIWVKIPYPVLSKFQHKQLQRSMYKLVHHHCEIKEYMHETLIVAGSSSTDD